MGLLNAKSKLPFSFQRQTSTRYQSISVISPTSSSDMHSIPTCYLSSCIKAPVQLEIVSCAPCARFSFCRLYTTWSTISFHNFFLPFFKAFNPEENIIRSKRICNSSIKKAAAIYYEISTLFWCLAKFANWARTTYPRQNNSVLMLSIHAL